MFPWRKGRWFNFAMVQIPGQPLVPDGETGRHFVFAGARAHGLDFREPDTTLTLNITVLRCYETSPP